MAEPWQCGICLRHRNICRCTKTPSASAVKPAKEKKIGKQCTKLGAAITQEHCDQHLTCATCLAGEILNLRAEVETLKVDCECHRIQAVDRGNSYHKAVAERDRYKAALERIAGLHDYSERGDELGLSEGAIVASGALAESVRGFVCKMPDCVG